jgi:intein/homing endonuclease
MRTNLVLKRDGKELKIEKVFNLPEDIKVSSLDDITFKNAPVNELLKTDGYYSVICILEKYNDKILAEVKMTVDIQDVKEYIKVIESEVKLND